MGTFFPDQIFPRPNFSQTKFFPDQIFPRIILRRKIYENCKFLYVSSWKIFVVENFRGGEFSSEKIISRGKSSSWKVFVGKIISLGKLLVGENLRRENFPPIRCIKFMCPNLNRANLKLSENEYCANFNMSNVYVFFKFVYYNTLCYHGNFCRI